MKLRSVKPCLERRFCPNGESSRLGPRIDAYLETIFDTLHLYRIEHDGLVFCWKDEAQYRSYTEYRPDSDRDAADLPPEETANAIRQILTDSISLPLPDLIKACAQIFGFARMGSNIEASMLRGIQEAVKRIMPEWKTDGQRSSVNTERQAQTATAIRQEPFCRRFRVAIESDTYVLSGSMERQ